MHIGFLSALTGQQISIVHYNGFAPTGILQYSILWSNDNEIRISMANGSTHRKFVVYWPSVQHIIHYTDTDILVYRNTWAGE